MLKGIKEDMHNCYLTAWLELAVQHLKRKLTGKIILNFSFLNLKFGYTYLSVIVNYDFRTLGVLDNEELLSTNHSDILQKKILLILYT